MTLPIEKLLEACGLHYTKEVDPQSGAAFHLPFEVSSGTVFVRLLVDEVLFASYVFLRSLDSIGVLTSKKDFLLALLKLNATSMFARVSIWVSKEDEVEWILVTAESPSEGLTAGAVKSLIQETVNLADRVATTIQEHSTNAQRQLAH